MPTSDKQIAANRRNARKSTGPRTPSGKAVSSRNALKHGILARETLITSGAAPEDAGEFTHLLTSLAHDLAPEGRLEELLVQQIAIAYWRLRRVLRADSAVFARIDPTDPGRHITYFGADIHFPAPSIPGSDDLTNILRYEGAMNQNLTRALAQLNRLQAERKTQNHDQNEPTESPV